MFDVGCFPETPLTPALSPLLRRGERKKKTALRKIVAGRDDSFL